MTTRYEITPQGQGFVVLASGRALGGPPLPRELALAVRDQLRAEQNSRRHSRIEDASWPTI